MNPAITCHICECYLTTISRIYYMIRLMQKVQIFHFVVAKYVCRQWGFAGKITWCRGPDQTSCQTSQLPSCSYWMVHIYLVWMHLYNVCWLMKIPGWASSAQKCPRHLAYTIPDKTSRICTIMLNYILLYISCSESKVPNITCDYLINT